MLVKMETGASGGGGSVAQGSFTISSTAQQETLPFTPTKVCWYTSNGTKYASATKDTTNNIDIMGGYVTSAFAYKDAKITIGTNSVSINPHAMTSGFDGFTCYWFATKE